MSAQPTVDSLSISVPGFFEGVAQGPIGIAALVFIVVLVVACGRWRARGGRRPASVKRS